MIIHLSFKLILLTTILILILPKIAKAGKTVRRRHFRRQIKENINKLISEDNMSEECKEPEDLKNQMLTWWNENDIYDEDSDYISADNKESDSHKLKKLYNEIESNDNLFEDENYGYGIEHKICVQLPEKTVDSSIMQRSLCPWQKKLNYDKEREPKFISEAKCLCRKSRGLSGSYCMPIKRKFSVLKRVACNPITKRYEYVKKIEVITVGCHSVLPRSQRALPISAFFNNNQDKIEVKK